MWRAGSGGEMLQEQQEHKVWESTKDMPFLTGIPSLTVNETADVTANA